VRVYRHASGIEIRTGFMGTQFGEGIVSVRGKIRSTLAAFREQGIGVLSMGS
jgi:hypothetical protein